MEEQLMDEGCADEPPPSLKEISDGIRRLSIADPFPEEYLHKMLSERRGSYRPQPKQTVAYEVQPSDTLEGIAIRYNITASELSNLNKLSSRTIFPGQTIFIPEKNSLQTFEEILKLQNKQLENEQESEQATTDVASVSPKPGRVERVPEGPLEKVLRLNSKYVTDGEGVVNGLLIVTPKHLIFEPNVSDPLVKEYGMEKYGVEAPLECIMRAALLPDIGRSCSTVYHPNKNAALKKSHPHIESRPNKSRMTGSKSCQENLTSICEVPDEDKHSDHRRPDPQQQKRRGSIDPLEPQQQQPRRGSVDSTSSSRRGSLEISEVEKEKKSLAVKVQKGLAKSISGIRRMSLPAVVVSDEKKPLDKMIPRPAASFPDIPLYLCLRMGQQTEASHAVAQFNRQIKPEYWFTVPRESVDELYFFFHRCCPEKYGEMEEILGPPSEPEPQPAPLPSRRASLSSFFHRRKSSKEIPTSPEGWEFVDHESVKPEPEPVLPPELLTPSKILDESQLLEIQGHLPARAMNAWELIYGTAVHGFSLKTMYRAMQKYDSPVLIVIVSRSDAVFGALLSSPLRMSDHFYGTGESFLFTFYPEFKFYGWTGLNDYFIKGNIDSFVVGSSEGHFGLWLDDDLFRGRTHECDTFRNELLCPEGDFEVKSLEAYGFP